MSHREDLENTGRKILNSTRTDLYLSMHFMGPALGALDYIMDLSTTTIGTDAVFIRFNPNYLMENFLVRPWYLNRVYMHILMHCIFRHMFSARQHEDQELWDLACDIAAESVIDSMDYPAIRQTMTDKRAAIYTKLTDKVKVLTAERLYRYLTGLHMDYSDQVSLAAEFHMDDHSFWQRMNDEAGDKEQQERAPQTPPPSRGADHPDQNSGDESASRPPRAMLNAGGLEQKEKEWEKNADRIRVELAAAGRKASDETGSLERLLSFETRREVSYKEYLKRFRILREEPKADPESFDYGFYYYGLQMYGNVPLLEENEYRVTQKIQQLAIAIDTSASCQATLVQQFLNETATLLLTGDHFFTKAEIHILECDDQIQNDIVIHHPEDMRRYADGFSMKGGYGTDFRPVFRYIEELRRKGELSHLKGLLYFTDGFGTYPKKATDYDTAFVFVRGEEMDDEHVPDWAMKLYV